MIVITYLLLDQGNEKEIQPWLLISSTVNFEKPLFIYCVTWSSNFLKFDGHYNEVGPLVVRVFHELAQEGIITPATFSRQNQI